MKVNYDEECVNSITKFSHVRTIKINVTHNYSQ